jgi:pimeloyl-ACP methyl ester carboxylesterase
MRFVTLAALTLSTGCEAQDDLVSTPEALVERKVPESGYAPVNGLSMYYEIHGELDGKDAPLVVLHGGLCTIDGCLGPILPALSENRTVIAIEQQAHGHTGDIDRPLDHVQMAEDTVALLDHLGVEEADFFGYSMGGITAQRIAYTHPDRVERLVVLSPSTLDNVDPSLHAVWDQLAPEVLPPYFYDAYAAVAPDPTGWPDTVAKVRELILSFHGWPDQELAAIDAPLLTIVGEYDLVLPAYLDYVLALLPDSEVAIVPNAGHFSMAENPEALLSMIEGFLDD